MATEAEANQGAPKERETDRDKETCFTIMPFGGYFDQYYVNIYKPAIEAAGLVSCRADDLYRPGTIVHDIWDYTQNAKIILADLTGKNPNVFYELGLAHAVAKPVILVTESIADVPFDLRALRVLDYDKNIPDWGAGLQEKIKNSILEVLRAPLEAVLPAFLKVKESIGENSVTEYEREILEIKQDLELLRQQMVHPSYDYRPDIGEWTRVPMSTANSLTPSEARRKIEAYLDAGMARGEMLSRLTSRGVPLDWAELRIAEAVYEKHDRGHPAAEAIHPLEDSSEDR